MILAKLPEVIRPMSSENPPSLWSQKPWWCQPWSIGLTGISIIGGSWILFKLVWLTVIVSLPVLAWMFFFLIVYPSIALSDHSP